MRILALDLATACGWAFWQPGAAPICSTRHLPDCGDNLGLFLVKFECWLEQKIGELKPTRIVIEKPILKRGRNATPFFTALKLMSLYGLACKCACEAGVSYEGVEISTWRGHFIPGVRGKSKVLKAAAVAKCEELGLSPRDDNAAEATGILSHEAHRRGLRIDWPRRLPDAGLQGSAGGLTLIMDRPGGSRMTDSSEQMTELEAVT